MDLIHCYACCSRIGHQNLLRRAISFELNLKMPNGYQCFQKEKQLIFNVMNFVDGEKNSWRIPFYNANERLKAIVGISMHSLERLGGEFRED